MFSLLNAMYCLNLKMVVLVMNIKPSHIPIVHLDNDACLYAVNGNFCHPLQGEVEILSQRSHAIYLVTRHTLYF
jgi:hypothetical protein